MKVSPASGSTPASVPTTVPRRAVLGDQGVRQPGAVGSGVGAVQAGHGEVARPAEAGLPGEEDSPGGVERHAGDVLVGPEVDRDGAVGAEGRVALPFGGQPGDDGI